MKLDEGLKLRLQFLSRVVKKEANDLQDTDARLFAKALDVSDLQRIAQDALLASLEAISPKAFFVEKETLHTPVQTYSFV